MVLVDTSVWINHLRNNDKKLVQLLNNNLAHTHNLVIGELATGNIKNRKNFLADLCELPRAENCQDHEIWHFIEIHKLHGTGLSYIDIHLLAACKFAALQLYSLDKKLQSAAKNLNLAYS